VEMSEERALKERIENEEDFINYPRYKNSLKVLVDKNPDGVDNKKISKALMIDEEEVEKALSSAIAKISKIVG